MRISFRNDGTEGEGRIKTREMRSIEEGNRRYEGEEGDSKERSPTPICVISTSVKMTGFPVLVWI